MASANFFMEFFYPPSLPIVSSLDRLRELLIEHQIVIVAGETGSGKTTQLPKLCLELFHGSRGWIGCTQPRRIAATSVAERVAEELGKHKELVGSKIRFRDKTTPATRIKFMTDGVLLAEIRNDPLLRKYKVVIVDEAHERNLNIDFLLGYLYTLAAKRDDLKLIITSATIDTEAFSAHFHQAPVVIIEGRTYPVEIIYSPPPEDDNEISYLEHCIDVTAEICATSHPGDVLLFLPTEKDIRSCSEILKGRVQTHRILPLFGRLQAKDQRLIFKTHNNPKIVVATNVAETSVTVPGIRYVVDSGLARIGSYHPRSRTMRLPITTISQASCNQRSGRSGRIGPGTCYRLFSEDDFDARAPFSTPEIQRSNLAEVILQMVALNLGDPYHFPFLDPPRRASISEGFRTLRELGALDAKNRLTPYGKLMSSLPIDPVISRIIIEANKFNCLSEIVAIAAALAIQEPRIRPAEKEHLADEAHRRFADPNSDFIGLLNIWKVYHKDHHRFSWSGLKKFCQHNFLSFQRMREWLDLHEQLYRLIGTKKNFRFNLDPGTYENIHRSLLAGLFRQCGRRKKGSLYQGLANREFNIFPGSYLHGKSGNWIIGGSFIETSRLFALSIANIEPEWLEKSCEKLCSYSWANVRYHKKSGRVMADETVALHGLIIASSRMVNYPKRNSKNIPAARQIFIREALVNSQLSGRFDFLNQNLSLLETWQESEHKLRKKDIVIDDEAVFDFYDRQLPAQVYDRSSLRGHIKRHGDSNLYMTETDILLRLPSQKALLDFPPHLPAPNEAIRLNYHFEPGTFADGVTALIPEHLLERITPELFDWLVPGLIVEKTTFLIKGLPKRLRKNLIPVNDTVALVLDSLDMYQGNFLQKLSAAILNRHKINIRREDWPQSLPPHLIMHFQVVNSSGKVVMRGNDFSTLLKQFRSGADHGSLMVSPRDQTLMDSLRDRIFNSWDFGAYPERIPLLATGDMIGGYLFCGIRSMPEKQGVMLHYYPSREEADCATRAGMNYLVRLDLKPKFKQLAQHCKVTFSGPSSIWLTTFFRGPAQTCESVLNFIISSFLSVTPQEMLNQETYKSQIDKIGKMDVFNAGREIIDKVLFVLRQRKETYDLIVKYEQLAKKSGGLDATLYEDLYNQLATILPSDFLDHFSLSDLDSCGRYLKSLAIRSERAYNNPGKDLEKRKKLNAHQQNIERFMEKFDDLGPECLEKIDNYKKMLAELRISLFSPEIKTTISVSEKKLVQAWKDLTTGC
ncbi:MAG: ATP-dependent RNA helicase HrpA [Desulfofustis sp.]|nr:ATP-dependent RNA helicase HrpA [Desulfofustis sp.]